MNRKTQCILMVNSLSESQCRKLLANQQWNEGLHPRDENGRFSHKGMTNKLDASGIPYGKNEGSAGKLLSDLLGGDPEMSHGDITTNQVKNVLDKEEQAHFEGYEETKEIEGLVESAKKITKHRDANKGYTAREYLLLELAELDKKEPGWNFKPWGHDQMYEPNEALMKQLRILEKIHKLDKNEREEKMNAKTKMILMANEMSESQCERIIALANGIWEENLHPRENDGKFAPKGQGEIGVGQGDDVSKHTDGQVQKKTEPAARIAQYVEEAKNLPKTKDRLKWTSIDFAKLDLLDLQGKKGSEQEQLEILEEIDALEAMNKRNSAKRSVAKTESSDDERKKVERFHQLEAEIDNLEEGYGETGELVFPNDEAKKEYLDLVRERDEINRSWLTGRKS